jgi:hypothetical protein
MDDVTMNDYIEVWKHFGNIYEYTTVLHYWRERAHRLFDSPQQSL